MSLAGKIAAAALGLPLLKCGPHLSRYAMYGALQRLDLKRLIPARGTLLSISHSRPFASVLGLRHLDVTDANYPDVNILNLPYPDNTFDVVISDQVFEHIEGNPERAADECRRVLKPGGIVVHTTVFIHPLHGSPNDYWRYSPDALRWLHRSFSEVIVADGWGNRAVWIADALKLRFMPVPHARWHPLHWIATARHPDWMTVTWIVARK